MDKLFWLRFLLFFLRVLTFGIPQLIIILQRKINELETEIKHNAVSDFENSSSTTSSSRINFQDDSEVDDELGF